MKVIQVCVICGAVFGCIIDEKYKVFCTDCHYGCAEDRVCSSENTICEDCADDEDWQV